MAGTIAPPAAGASRSERRAVGAPPPVALTPEAAAILVRLAHAVVAVTASGRTTSMDLSAILPRDPPACLVTPAGAFVTLHQGEELRGCVGLIAPDQPLWRTVVSAAVSAARDPRFLPVTEEELPTISIDVSVLGVVVPLDDPSAFRPGIDGCIVERGSRRGLLLPEVATEHGWDAREMLEATCWKAGLPEDAWREPGTHLSVFRTTRVSEAASIA
ncbi:MAG TPA: AmmeMemoRadiSam system protein A [Candidatus Deferrimicrobium sp.]|nr:AmmeMemoRadiSam system protein A [Candidatus Deferrimicrobium sp.]